MNSNESLSNALLIAVIVCVALSTLPAAAMGLGTTAQSDELTLAVDGQDGETVTVLISTGASDVAGLDANITFDPSVVQVASVEGVDLSDPVQNANNDDGWLVLSQAQADGVDAPTTTKITFEIVADGTMTLDFVDADTSLYDSTSSPIPASLSGTSEDVTRSDGETDDGSDGSNGTDDTDDGDDSTGTDGTDGEQDDPDDRSGGERDDGSSGYEQDEGDETDGQTEDSEAEQTDDDEADGDDAGDDTDEDSDEHFILHFGVLMVLAGVILAVAVLAYDRS